MAPEVFSGHSAVTTRVAETTCRSQVSSAQMASADRNLQQKLVVNIPRMGKEELKSISSKGSTQHPRSSTPVEGASARTAATSLWMWIHRLSRPLPEAPVLAWRLALKHRERALHKDDPSRLVHARDSGKQRATDQQGVHDMVANVMEHQGISREGWEQSQKADYRVDPLYLPEWVVYPPPGQHLATLEGASVDEWRAEPDITANELLRQLTVLAEGTSQACSHRSQESYFRSIQLVKAAIQGYENEQGLQYHEKPVHLDSAIAGRIIATITHLQQELHAAKDARQEAWD